jgi:hypothetical protein
MSEDQKRILEQQLWNIANTLRGKMNADEFRDYILGFIFYRVRTRYLPVTTVLVNMENWHLQVKLTLPLCNI